MSDDSSNSANSTGQVDPVHQLLQENNNGVSGQALTAEERNERREALLKRQRESREKAQQISQAARANAATSNNSGALAASAPTPSATTPTTATATATATAAPVSDAPIRENMVQQAVSFLSSPSVQSAEESKKIQFLEKKGLTTKEIELARARLSGTASTPAVSAAPQPQQPQQQQPYQPVSAPPSFNPIPPPVPPRDYTRMPVYVQQQQIATDPNAFKKKLVIAMLISGGVTVLTSIIVQKLIYPMVRGITGARQSLAVSQTDLLSKLKEKLLGYREYLLGLHLGSNYAPVKKIKDTKTTVEEEEERARPNDDKKTTTTTTTTATSSTLSAVATTHQTTVKQLDEFSKKLESHAHNLNFEQLKATRAMTQDLAEYITKETYSLTGSVAYPTSRYYGYNAAGAAASGKGGLADPTTPEAALKSEIRSLKGLLLNWRNFPVAKEASASVLNGSGALPSLVQQQ